MNTNLRLLRKQARISLSELAEELDLSVEALRSLEAGEEHLAFLAGEYVEALTYLTGPVAEWQTQPTQNRLRALQTPELQVQVLPGLPTN